MSTMLNKNILAFLAIILTSLLVMGCNVAPNNPPATPPYVPVTSTPAPVVTSIVTVTVTVTPTPTPTPSAVPAPIQKPTPSPTSTPEKPLAYYLVFSTVLKWQTLSDIANRDANYPVTCPRDKMELIKGILAEYSSQDGKRYLIMGNFTSCADALSKGVIGLALIDTENMPVLQPQINSGTFRVLSVQ